MAVQFDFSRTASGVAGRFTSVSQWAMEYPLDKVEVSGAKIHWVLGGSLIFDGEVSAQAITGHFRRERGEGRSL